MSCTASVTLEVAQFAPNVVESEANTVFFGPTSVEGEVVMWSEIQGLDTYFLQQDSSAKEDEAQQVADYTDGYAVRLKYHWPISSGDGTYAACLVSETKNALSCWAITITSAVIDGDTNYYETSGIDTSTLDLASATSIDPTCAWFAGFDKFWSISYTTDASNHQVTGARFLPKLDGNSSPTDDYRFAPMGSENPDQASDTAVWIYEASGTSWTAYAVEFQGAVGLLGAASAAIALLIAF